jgi:curved DNA-binding protein CbpA
MDIKRSFEILELDSDASIDEVKEAYKDLVNIWHPDRFSNNPRLKQRAEKKLKEVNQAYETIKSLLPSKTELEKEAEKTPHVQAQAKTQAKPRAQAAASRAEAKTKTEAVVEAGTFAFLDLWSYLSTKLRRIVAEQVQAFKEGAQGEPWEINQRQGRGRGKGSGKGGGVGRGRGRGQGMGRGSGRGGRGMGSGGGRGRRG